MLKSMGLSRRVSAIGETKTLIDAPIGADGSLWCSSASFSVGNELMACEFVVPGQSHKWSSPLRVGHGVLKHSIDAAAINGLWAPISPDGGYQKAQGRLVATLAKAEVPISEMICNKMYTMYADNDISLTYHTRGFFGGLLAGLIRQITRFVSGCAEHQDPDGGSPIFHIYTTQQGKLT
jgi:cyanuric acid amidohydrolase